MLIPLALISLAVGFKLFVDSTKEINSAHRSFGRILGLYVMVLSFALSVLPLVKASCLGKSAYHCPIAGKSLGKMK